MCTNAHILLKASQHSGGQLLEGPGGSNQLCAHVCESDVSVPAAGVELRALGLSLHVHTPATGETCIQGPVTGQTECLSTAFGEIHNVHLYIFLLFSHLSCHRGQEGEAVGAVCAHVSAECFCLCYLCVWPSTYPYRSCTCAPAGNILPAMLLAGLGVTELWQPCLCQAAEFSHIP